MWCRKSASDFFFYFLGPWQLSTSNSMQIIRHLLFLSPKNCKKTKYSSRFAKLIYVSRMRPVIFPLKPKTWFHLKHKIYVHGWEEAENVRLHISRLHKCSTVLCMFYNKQGCTDVTFCPLPISTIINSWTDIINDKVKNIRAEDEASSLWNANTHVMSTNFAPTCTSSFFFFSFFSLFSWQLANRLLVHSDIFWSEMIDRIHTQLQPDWNNHNFF